MTAALLLEAVSAKTGSFDFLTYNVAGLPAILNPNQGGDKAVNARAIGTKLAAGAYDVVHLQEVSPLTAIYSDPNTYSFQSYDYEKLNHFQNAQIMFDVTFIL